MGQNWVGTETAGCDLGDARLNRRLEAMLGALGERPGKSLPAAFQDCSNTKAPYRFFANGNVSEDKILDGHFAASALRIQATDGSLFTCFRLAATFMVQFRKDGRSPVRSVPAPRPTRRADHKNDVGPCGSVRSIPVPIQPAALPSKFGPTSSTKSARHSLPFNRSDTASRQNASKSPSGPLAGGRQVIGVADIFLSRQSSFQFRGRRRGTQRQTIGQQLQRHTMVRIRDQRIQHREHCPRPKSHSFKGFCPP
jgi:hypothetical protein|tara:strand:- start:5902 stop:6660 length:759 start_codon:yes stop_codon:yes gene_type:complete